MLIKASQRANGRELARHLMNGHDNEHVSIHELKGFLDNTVMGAFIEVEAVSKGTKCVQPLFSVSFNPPLGADVSTADFEDAINRVEDTMNLNGQPRVVVFHEKHGRRHAHSVWSRIDTEEMKAINLPFFKERMKDISRELYIEHDWDMPQGFIDKELRNPLNFSREEWQQAKRLNDSPKAIKLALRESWSISDNKKAFQAALEQRGFYLARGDRRGFVAVDWRGEAFSLSRWLGVKTKELKNRLGDTKDLPTVEETIEKINQSLKQRIGTLLNKVDHHYSKKRIPLDRRKTEMKQRHQAERQALEERQQKRQAEEQKQRFERFSGGVRGLWDRVTGKHAQTIKRNELEAYEGLQRDKQEKDSLIYRQLDERQSLQKSYGNLKQQQESDISKARELVFSTKMSQERVQTFENTFDTYAQSQSMSFDMEM